MRYLAVCILLWFISASLMAQVPEAPEVITISIEDPYIQRKVLEEGKIAAEKESRKIKNIPKTILRDVRNLKSEMKNLFGKNYEPGRLTGEPLSPGKHSDAAEKYSKGGDYYRAVCAWLDALDIKKKQNYIKKVRSIAEKAYKQKLRLAQESIQEGDKELGLEHYEQLGLFQKSLFDHDLIFFEVLDIGAAVEDIRFSNAQGYYSQAEMFFGKEFWEEALVNYKKVAELVNNFQDVQEKIGLSLYEIGSKQLKDGAYEESANSFLEATKAWNSDEIRTATDILNYELGEYYYSNGRYRSAFKRWERLRLVDPGYLDVFEKVGKAKEKAMIVISINNLKCNEAIDGTGAKIQALKSAIKKSIQEAASEFVVLDDYSNKASLYIEGIIEFDQVLDDLKSEKRFVSNVEAVDGKKGVYKYKQTDVHYVEKVLRREVRDKLSLKISNVNGNVYNINCNVQWERHYVWAEVESTTKKEFWGTGGELRLVGDMVQEIKGSKNSLMYFNKLSKVPPPGKDSVYAEISKSVAGKVAEEILNRVDRELPLEKPIELNLSFGQIEQR